MKSKKSKAELAGLKKVSDDWKWTDTCKIVGFYRRSLNLSKNELSRLLGVALSTAGVWERGIKEPKASSLVKMAKLFGVSETELLHPSEEMKERIRMMNLEET